VKWVCLHAWLWLTWVDCVQVFFVAEAQRKALEVAIARADETQFDDETAQRFMLSPGDTFFVPPNNVYRLENHSEQTEAKVFYIIVKVGFGDVATVAQLGVLGLNRMCLIGAAAGRAAGGARG
jgi:hypothetical protein